MISRDILKERTEEHFHAALIEEKYEITEYEPSTLLTHNRFDLAFKLLYLQGLESHCMGIKYFYDQHIHAITNGTLSEHGNSSKTSLARFRSDFEATYKSIRVRGFDAVQTVLPLSENNSIANGAHRLASAIYAGKKVSAVNIACTNALYDWRFFYQRNVSESQLDAAATAFIEYGQNVYIALIWPIAKGSSEELRSLIPRVVYEKSIRLEHNGAHNLLSQVYAGEPWLGSVEDNYAGVSAKLNACFKGSQNLRVIAFQADSLDQVLDIKDKVRNLFGVGKHSVHITDTKEEAVAAARILFNKNSQHFLNNAKPNRFLSTHRKIKQLDDFVGENKLDCRQLLVDGSLVLSLYGLRESRDIDYLHDGLHDIQCRNTKIDSHDETLVYHAIQKSELIYNPEYHFYFGRFKFVSFDQLYAMKKRRAEKKDVRDCEGMLALLNNQRVRQTLNSIKQRYYYEKTRSTLMFASCLKKVGLYSAVRWAYLKLKGKR